MTSDAAADLSFLEIEHKFLVPDTFDVAAFERQLLAWKPEKHYETEVCDSYYIVKAAPNLVYRHRYDNLLQQLTIKSLGDNEVRLEVNLDLDLTKGNQWQRVEGFLRPLGILHSARLEKKVKVFYFENAEIVFYRASHQDLSISCIEIEARHHASVDEGKKILGIWESRLGLDPERRCRDSLLKLLVLPRLPQELRQAFG